MAANSTQCPTLITRPEDRIGHILAGHLELKDILGVGAYGVVYIAEDRFTRQRYAVKALSKEGLDARQRRFQQREIALHHRVSSHPNIVSLIKILEAPDCTYVVIEYCPEGDLFANITEQGHFVGNDLLAKRVFLQLLDAVEHCHNMGIYHRDLKPENILVCDGGYQVKLADFGLATTDRVTSDFGCGSTFYMSPECQQQTGHKGYHHRPMEYYASAPNDVWSLGVILVNLTCGRNPWKRAAPSDSTFRAYLKNSRFLRTILPLSQELDDILRCVFEIDPLKRITIRELRNRIQKCQRFTTGPSPMCTITPPASETSGSSGVSSNEELPPHQYFQQFHAPPNGVLTPPPSSPTGYAPPPPTGYPQIVYSSGHPPITPPLTPVDGQKPFMPPNSLFTSGSPPHTVSITWQVPSPRPHYFPPTHLMPAPQGVQCH